MTLDRQKNKFEQLCSLALDHRLRNRDRFRGPHQWRRLLSLAIILIDFAVIGIAGNLYPLALIIYQPGAALILGGATLIIIMMRIAKPSVFADWTCLAMLQIAIGIILMRDPVLISPLASLCASSLSIGSSLLTIWIGITTWSSDGRAWIIAAGITGACSVIAGIIDHHTTSVLVPDVGASVCLLLIGMSLFGLALSLRRS